MLLALFLLLVAPLVAQSDDVLVSAPGVLKLGVPNNVAVHLISNDNQLVIIEAYKVGNRVAREEKTVAPGSPTLFTLKIDASSIDGGSTGSPCNGSVSLLVQCPALGLRRQVDVGVECSGASVYVFTDKTVYTPGQTVSLRVACLDWKLTSYEEKLTIDVKNPTGIIVRRWSRTSSKSRLIDLKFIIDNEPMLGWWTIEVHPEEDSAALPVGSSKFEVKEYVVPRFGVTIESPDIVQNSTNSFDVTVRAMYTYGKAVKGKVTIEFGALYEKTYRAVVIPGQKDWTKILRDGEAIFTINLEHIQRRLPYGFPNGGRLKVKARVTSDGIGLVEESTVENTVFSVKSVLLDTSKSRRFFKPGLPYDLEVFARRPSGPPVESVDITLQAFVRKKGQPDWVRISFTGHNTQTRRTDVSGYTQFVFDVPQGSIKLKLQLQAAGNAWTETELFPEASSLQEKYLLIRDTQEVFEICTKTRCSQEHFEVYSSDTNLEVNLCHILICRGVIMVSKCRSVSSWPTQVSLELRAYASPCCKLLVFYQLSGSFVADFTTVYSQMAFPNNISIRAVYRTNQAFYAPKDTMDFEISGIPGSTVYLTAVDEGVLLLGDNRVTALEVFNRLRGCSLGCDVRGGRDIDGIFKNAGLVYATLSTDIDYSPICFPPLKVEPTLSNLEECCERGRMHCKDCEAQRQLLIDEDIHSDECVDSFSKCCEVASQLISCNFQSRARSQSQQNFQNAKIVLPTTYRSYFPESWLRDIVTISDRGVSTKSVNLPDSITAWRIHALGVSGTGLYGMSNPISLRVFSPIFLEVSLPYSVVRNEQFAVKATVFNYNERANLDDVFVQLRSHSFDLCTAAGTGRYTEKQHLSSLASKSSHTFIFAVVPMSLGDIKIEVILTTFFRKESVMKVVRVEPEGIENEIAFSNPVDPSAASLGIQHFTFNLTTPEKTVKDSSRSYFYVTGNILGSVVALKGFDELLQQPYGCGEQNMINFCPNVIVLIYLNRTGQLNQNLLETGVANIRHGYSRQLLFRRTQPPGSFSAFGDSDSHGSTWLTAFVLKCFCQVKHLQLPFRIIDKAVIKTGLEWLSTQQLASGEFEERGRVLDIVLQGGVQAQKCSLTAFVLIAYLECSSWSRDISVDLAPTVSLAAGYLIKYVALPDPCSNTFELAISGYALCLAKERRASGKAIGQLWQCANVNLRSSTVDWVATSPTRAVAVETSAYALQGYICNGDQQSASLIANWLNLQRGLGGGFVSTQDTVIAIQALAAYAEKRFGKDSQLTVTVNSQPADSSAASSITKQISGNDANMRHAIPVNNNSIVTVTVRGSGTGLVQCGMKYNSLQDTSDRGFTVIVNTFDESSETLKLEITIRYNRDDGSGMAVAAIHLLSGFVAIDNSLKDVLKAVDVMKRYENRGQTVNFYFEKIANRTITFSIYLNRKVKVGFIQQAPIHVYDYYNPDVSATKFYAPDSESPLLALLCKGSSCQCGAGKCPSCDKLQGSRQRLDKDSSSCPNIDKPFGKLRIVTIEELQEKTCALDFAYKFRVTKVTTICRNGWTKVLGRIEEIFKPGLQDFAEDDKIRVWKRADCSCPGFRKGKSYLYVGNDGPKFLVDFNAIVLNWKTRAFNDYVSYFKDKGGCG